MSFNHLAPSRAWAGRDRPARRRRHGADKRTRGRRQTRPRQETDTPAAGDQPPAETEGDSLQCPPLRRPLSRFYPGSPAALLFHCRWPRQAHRAPASTYFHRRVIHMIVFSRPPGWKRRVGDPGSAGGFAEARVGTSSSGARALRRPRKATLWAALQALRTLSRGPCDALASRRTTLLAEQPTRPSDVSPFYESKYWMRHPAV